MPGYVAVVTIHLHFGEVHDLKAKRKELKSFTEQLRGRLGVAVAEVDHMDKWQRSTVVVSAVSGTARGVEDLADRIARFADSRFPDGVRVERALASVDEMAGLR
jgi:uncharacterized protein YlxP (DUF503 family)